ncbi:unnamed protein product [Miscanthus lutarioriparius]|uniref:Exocyst subunit Exo70 family protein n=1 Tax=Miscanthus lutarioriparius TaxID=422564 RepID=A0A811SCD5_9POAL|nr:unnamed protein product [Miscanthus lutarioriparius]
MAGRNGGRGSYWSYHQETGSIISSSSGTIVSTAYISNVSRPSTFSMEPTTHFLSLGIHGDINGNSFGDWEKAEEEEADQEEETENERIRRLVQEFYHAPSANRSIKIGDTSVVERWLKELGVGWVLSLDDGASAVEAEELHRHARSWIRALDEIAQTICSTRPLFRDGASVGLPSICEGEGEHVGGRCIPDRYHLALFIQETMLKILDFVEFIVALDPNAATVTCGIRAPYLKISILLLVHDALSEASTTKISLTSHPPPSAQVRRIEDEMASFLSAKQDKATEAIQGTMADTWARIMESVEDSACSPTLNGLSDIHDVTRSVTFHIRYLWLNYRSLYPIVLEAARSSSLGKYVTKIGDTIDPIDRLVIQMISCLEEKVAKRSQSFPDKGLRYLSLINNLCYVSERVHSAYVSAVLTRKIEDCIQTYLQESWAPVFSCLTQPRCFGKNYSPLPKFESAFQRNYNTQKLWKVPDPRRTLRKAITEKIISALDDNNVSTPKFTPDRAPERDVERAI